MLLDSKPVKTKRTARAASSRARSFVTFTAIAGLVLVAGAGYAGDTRSCGSQGGACQPDESSAWRPPDLAQFPTFSDSSASASDSSTPQAASIDSTFESSHDSDGLIIHKGDSANSVDLEHYQLTWHDAPLTAQNGSHLIRLASQSLEAASDPIEGVHLDVNFGAIARYLHAQDPIGSIKATGTVVGTELAVSVTRQLQTDSLATIRNGIFSTEQILSGKRKLFWGFKFKAELHHRSLSDGNSSNSIVVAPEYDIQLLGFDLGLGYRFHYVGFAEHTHNGYYNPLVSRSQQIFWDVGYDARRCYFSFDVAGGRGTSKSSATSTVTSDFSGEGTGTVGWRINERVLAELTVSGGDYGLNCPATSWAQMSTALRVKYSF